MATSWPAMDWTGPSVEEADVAAFEQQYGHSLPDDYRRFLLEVNGGRLADESTTFDDGIVNILFSLGLGEDYRADLLTCAMWMRPRLPSPDLLPIGFDSGGGRLLLALVGEHRGEIWFENTSEPAADGAKPRVKWFQRREMRKLADSFEAFLRSLQPRPVYVLDESDARSAHHRAGRAARARDKGGDVRAATRWPAMEWRGPVVHEADVAAFEREYGHPLPADYRQFLLEVNGGRLADEIVVFDGFVDILLSLGLGEHDEADLRWCATRMRPQLPSPDLLPIGFDIDDAPLLLVLVGEHRGEVWNQNTLVQWPEDADPQVKWFERLDMKKRADSFEGLLRLVQAYEPGESDG